MFRIPLFLLSCLLFSGSALAADVSGLIAKLDSEDYGLRKTARLDLRQALADASGAERAAMIAELHQSIRADNSFATRDWSIRMLELFGEEPSVLPLAQLLIAPDERIRDRARMALQANPSGAATRVLENALDGVPVEQKAAFLDALAYRGDEDSINQVAPWLNSDSDVVAANAALALGKIGGDSAEAALLKRYSSTSPALKLDVELALLDVGLSDATVAQVLASQGQSVTVRLGAFQQLIALDAEAASSVFIAALDDENTPGRNQLIRIALASPMQAGVIARLSYLPLATQIIILGVISDLSLSQYELQVLALLKSASPELQTALVETLGVIGSDQSYAKLYELYLADSGNAVTKEALARLKAPVADAALLTAAADSSQPDEQVAAIELMALRNTSGAIDLINQLAREATRSELKKAAYKAMELIGNTESVEVLLASILQLDGDLRAAQGSLKKLSVSLDSSADLWAGAYAAALESATSDEQRKAILAILDGVSCQPAATYLQSLIVSDSSLRADALRSLSRWSDISAGDVWIALISQPGGSDADINAAQKGISRLIKQSGISGAPAAKIGFGVEAIKAAPSLEFKRSVLSAYENTKLDRKTKAQFKKSFKQFTSDPDIGDQVQALLK